MGFTYYLFLLTFLGFPIVGLLIKNNNYLLEISKYKKWIFLIFLLHNILFILGLSLKGDYVDYILFSIEYLVLCLTVFTMQEKTKSYLKAIKIVGYVGIIFGAIQGFIGILLFIVVSKDYETDKIFKFTSENKTFETRRYSFGFATLDETRYTFETYREFGIIPLEYKIDETDFFDQKTKLNIAEQKLKIEISTKDNLKQICFISTNGNEYTKTIK